MGRWVSSNYPRARYNLPSMYVDRFDIIGKQLRICSSGLSMMDFHLTPLRHGELAPRIGQLVALCVKELTLLPEQQHMKHLVAVDPPAKSLTVWEFSQRQTP